MSASHVCSMGVFAASIALFFVCSCPSSGVETDATAERLDASAGQDLSSGEAGIDDSSRNDSHGLDTSAADVTGFDSSGVDAFGNTAPRAFASSQLAARGTSTVLIPHAEDDDNDALTFHVVHAPLHGSLDTSGATWTFSPEAGYIGPDELTFFARDSSSSSNTATLTLIIHEANGGTFFVDAADASCDDNGVGSEATPWCTIAKAAQVLTAGQLVLIKEGLYAEALTPSNSGQENAYLMFCAYPGDVVRLRDVWVEYGLITVEAKHYLVFDGLQLEDVRGFVRCLVSDHIVVRNSVFSHSTLHDGMPTGEYSASKKGGVYFWQCHDSIVQNNVILEGTDSLSFIYSDRNRLLDNHFEDAGHTLFAIKCGSDNVVRGNYFYNRWEKTGEIFDCEEPTTNWVGNEGDLGDYRIATPITSQTRRNLVEDNHFAYVPAHVDRSPYEGIQYSGQEGIVRNNIFTDLVGPGISYRLYGHDEAVDVSHNRFYHNVFAHNHHGGVTITDVAQGFADNVLFNNVFYDELFIRSDTRDFAVWYVELEGLDVHILLGQIDEMRIGGNGFFDSNNQDQTYAIRHGNRDDGSDPAHTDFDLAAWQNAYPDNFFANLVGQVPEFVDLDAFDLHPRSNSPLINAGIFLTTTRDFGLGRQLPVMDTRFFFDGAGIQGEQGDLIQLQGSSQRVRVLSIDRGNDILNLDQEVTWSTGQGVSLAYDGTAPDIGLLPR